MSLARNVFVQTGFTLGSRVLGFARDLALNYRFGGQGPLLDAWATTLMVPNFFRRLFAEGAFAQAFVPVFAKERATLGDKAAEEMASQTLAFMLAVVTLIVIGLVFAMPWLMPVLLSAYADDPGTMRTATLMAQLAMPYLACMTLATLLGGVLNTLGRFALTAGVQSLLNVFTIIPLIFAADREQAALAASIGVTVSGVFQAGLLWWGVRRRGVRLSIGVPGFSKVVRRVIALAVPGALAGGAMQLGTLVSQILAGSDPGARGVLYNADRLYQLPLGLIGVAVGLALVPRLSRHFAEQDNASADRTMDDGVVLSLAFTMPAAVALLVMPYFIIDAMLTRGQFSAEDARRTAEVLRHFAWGVPAFVLAKVFTPPFFARQKTRQPSIFAIIAVMVNAGLGAVLWFTLPQAGIDGAIGLAIATSIAGWLNVALLSGTLAAEKVYRISGRAWTRLARLGAACLVMGGFAGVCAWQYPLLSNLLFGKEIAVGVVGVAGFVVYVAAALGFRAITPGEVRQSLRREKGAAGQGLPPVSEG